MRRLLLGALILVTPLGVNAQARSATTIMNNAARAYAALSTFTADFRQRIDDVVMEDTEARGTLYQAGENRFAMIFTDPAGQIVIDGRNVWAYLPEDLPGQVIKTPVSSRPTYGYNLLGWFLDRPNEKYRATWLREESVDGNVTDVLQLDPLVPNMEFRRATVWIDRESSLPRKFELDEKSRTRTVALTRLRPNTAQPGGVYQFQVPAGVKVMER